MVKIIHNVGGIPGLDLALDAFSEDVERCLFESSVLFDCTPEQASFREGRNGLPTGPRSWDPDVWRINNLVGDLFPDKFVPPDYCLALSYPKSAQFGSHYDSRFRWGECVTGVNLGQAAIVYFTQQKGSAPAKWEGVEGVVVTSKTQKCGKLCVEITLPRRSIYTFHDEARLDWKHGIRHQTAARLKSFPAPSNWNPWNLRRSLTLRCTKAYSDAYLQHQLEQSPNDTKLQARWKQQKKFRPQHDYGDGVASEEQLAKLRAQGKVILNMVLHSPFRNLRFGDGFTGITSSGNRLGGGAMDEDDADLQAAIRLSLGESKLAASPSSNGGTASDPISLDDNDNENEAGSAAEPPNNESKRAASEQAESPESKRQRLRLARLRRFETANQPEV